MVEFFLIVLFIGQIAAVGVLYFLFRQLIKSDKRLFLSLEKVGETVKASLGKVDFAPEFYSRVSQGSLQLKELAARLDSLSKEMQEISVHLKGIKTEITTGDWKQKPKTDRVDESGWKQEILDIWNDHSIPTLEEKKEKILELDPRTNIRHLGNKTITLLKVPSQNYCLALPRIGIPFDTQLAEYLSWFVNDGVDGNIVSVEVPAVVNEDPVKSDTAIEKGHFTMRRR